MRSTIQRRAVMLGLATATVAATTAVLPAVSSVRAAPTDDPGKPTQVDERFGLTVDDALTTSARTVAAYGRDGEVEVSGIAGPDGRIGEFAVGEVLVTGDEQAAMAAKQLGGEVVATLSPAELGIEEVPNIHLVAFDAGAVDPGRLVEDLVALSPDVAHGEHRVASKAGVGTLAAAAELAREGVTVALDWLTADSTIRTRSTTESTGLAAFGTNAFGWSPLTSIGVPEAWNVLARAGRLVPGTIPVGIVDSGFSPPDADRPAGGFADAPAPSPIMCSGGAACPFHGSDVTSTAMAIPDNSFGAAGPAGPVATPILVDRAGTPLIGDLTAEARAVGAGARIINMSFGAEVPAVAAVFMGSYDLFTRSVHNMGVLQVAAAGNAGIDVDRMDCFITCWEANYVIPCENPGVLCVGGLNMSGTSVTTMPAPGSNFGSGGNDPTATVDIWASFTSIAGPNSGAPANGVHLASGTSVSAPLVTGALALIWAANPAAAAATVEATLLGTARSGSCSGGRCATRIADALAGVNAQLPNLPPDVSINATSTTTVPRGTAVTFAAVATDPDGPAPLVRWFVDGVQRGTGPTFAYQSFSDGFGAHLVRATATDSFGFVVPDAGGGVTVTLVNTAPVVQITAPSAGTTWTRWRCRSQPGVVTLCPNTVLLTATANDSNNNPTALPTANVSWFLDGSATAFATGQNVSLDITNVADGPHTIVVRGTDGTFVRTAQVVVDVTSPIIYRPGP